MDQFFQYLNSFSLPLWLGMMFAPEHWLTKRAGRSSTVLGLTAVHYVVSLLWAMRHPTASDDLEATPSFTSLDGVNMMLRTREGTLAAWAHMLALDLFTGTWIYRQSRRLDAPAWVRIPALFFTFVSGPFGLLFFLLWRVFSGGEEEALDG